MLKTDPVKCPGIAEAAVAELRAALGDAERGDVDLESARLRLAARPSGARAWRPIRPWPTATDGYCGCSTRTRRTCRAGRRPSAKPGFARPETVALLRARNADRMLRTRRSLEAQAGLMLRRDLPYYAPAEAIALLEDGRFITNLPNRLRISRLLTDGSMCRRTMAVLLGPS